MLSADYVRQQLRGVWQLLKGDRQGYDLLDCSADGFWNSFWAPVFAAPVILLVLWADQRVMAEIAVLEPSLTFTANTGVYLLSESVAYYGGWIGYLILMISVTKVLGLADRFAVFTVAYNWASLITLGLALPPMLLYAAGLLSIDWMIAFQFGLLGVALLYRWFVAWTALRTGIMTAVGMVMVDLLFSLMLAELADRVHQVLV